jgi:methyl-accepting chemotaxis protein
LSVRGLLLAIFLSAIGISFLVTIGTMFFHLQVSRQYAQITNRLLLENRFATLAPSLLDSYLELATVGWSVDYARNQFLETRGEIDEIILELDSTIVEDPSRQHYQALRAFMLRILGLVDEGVTALQQGKISDVWDRYREDLGQIRQFVPENIGNLMVHELALMENLQGRTESLNRTISIVTSVLILLILLADIVLVRMMSRRITEPLTGLTDMAEAISQGDLDRKVAVELVKRSDEIGTLASSFDRMLSRLDTEIRSQKEANALVIKTNQEIAGKNEQLAKFNRLMVDRELKMVELKKKIAALGGKMDEGENGPSAT